MNAYAVQYVPLSGLGQPITAELRQASSRTASWAYRPTLADVLILYISSFESESH